MPAAGPVTEDEAAILAYHFLRSRESRELERVWKWVAEATTIDVTLHPGGRATLRHPYYSDFTVEIRWREVSPKERRVGSIAVLGEPDVPWPLHLDLEQYLAACWLRLLRGKHGAFGRMPDRRPKPGRHRKPDTAFYRRVVDAYGRLLADGHPNPTAEVAKRMNANRDTVKSWLRRGRQYLRREEEG